MEAAISAYQESIARRSPAMDKICDQYFRAELTSARERQRRANVVERLWGSTLYALRIETSYKSSGNENYKWPISFFDILSSQARALAEKWRDKGLVSPRLTEAIVGALRDCELIVRYFEDRFVSIEKNNSEHKLEGRLVSRHLRDVFPRQRDVLYYYEDQALRELDTIELQDIELDSKRGRELRRAAARDAEAIRQQWERYGDPIGRDLEAQLRAKGPSVDSEGDRATSISSQMWLMHLLRSYTWRLSRQSRACVQALCIASGEGDRKEANLLLCKGAFVNGFGEGNVTPLICAIRGQQVDIVRCLLDNRADPNLACGVTPLLEAVENKNLNIVKMLVTAGAKVNARNWPNESLRGATALYRAADLGLQDIVYLLLNQGADWTLNYCDHVADIHRITALHVAKGACAEYIYKVTQYEEDYRRASAKDSRGRLPIFWALEREDWHAIPYLDPRIRGADAIDVDGNSVMHIFCKHLSKSSLPKEALYALQQIKQMGPENIRRPNNKGQTPLRMLAAAAANRPPPDDAETDVFSACKKLILDVDFDHEALTANPGDYTMNQARYCFGTGPPITDEELERNLSRLRSRENHEAQLRIEQAAMFESMMVECRETTKTEEV